MLTVTGMAEFGHDGNLIVRVEIQPHVPHEHDLLTKVTERKFLNVYMLNGQLILAGMFSETQHDLLADLEQTPSSAPSDATSVSKCICGAHLYGGYHAAGCPAGGYIVPDGNPGT